MGLTRARGPGTDPIDVVMRLSVLLSAGSAAAAAWRHLAADGDPVAGAAADAAERGDDVAAVLRRAGARWHDLAGAWAVAVAVGAPLAETLRAVAAALREATEIRDDVTVALAEPAATARLLAWLPLVGVPLGIVFGFDTLAVLTGDPMGLACLGGGLVLVATSRAWSRRLVRRAQPPLGVPGLRAELWSVALSAGLSIDRARVLVAAQFAPDAVDADDVEATLRLSQRAGVPAGELLRATAWLSRHRARTEGRAAAARLSTRLLIPLGVCTLPAFLLLAVVPTVLAILRSGVLMT